MHIETLRAGDNFIYLLIEGTDAAVIDPGVAEPVARFLQQHNLKLRMILLTHYHGDHTGGVTRLREADCEVMGHACGSVALTRAIEDGACIDFAGYDIKGLSVAGHSCCDTAYYLAESSAIFSGDVLFAGGCGRLFTNNAGQMWASLCRLRELPDDTRVYGGHDYTLENLEFAAHLEPDNAAVVERLTRCRKDPQAALPSTLGEEKLTNPFLRCDNESLAAAAGMQGHNPVDVFAAVRGMKDRW